MDSALLCVFLAAAALILCSANTENMAATRFDAAHSHVIPPSCPLCPECRGCRCHNLAINCANTSLMYVPNMSPEVQDLVLGYNLLKRLNASTFQGLSQLRYLNLQYNQISYMEPGTFENLSYLLHLTLQGNPLTKLDDFIFSPLSSLTLIELDHTQAQFNARAFENVTSLLNLYLDSNKIRAFPRFVYNSTAIFPRLEYLSLTQNLISEFESEDMQGLKALKVLDLTSNQIYGLRDHHFAPMPALEKIRLGGNYLKNVHPEAFCHTRLKYLDLSASRIQLQRHDLRRAFSCIQNLETLLLDRVLINLRFTQLFQNLTKLKSLSLEGDDITRMFPDTFRKTNALEKLMISGNPVYLGSSNESALLEVAKTLKRLFANNCRFTEITEDFLPRVLWKNLSAIDLSANPFACNCQLIWFMRWLKRTNVTVLNYEDYRCYSPPELKATPLKHLPQTFEMSCFISVTPDYWLDIVIINVLLVSLLSTVGSLLHRFRWHVRYWRFVYEAKSREYQQLLDQREYEYDAFVIHSQADSQWVIRQLRPQLEENRPKLRLCISQRDWLGGRDITDNIVESIEVSRKSLLIVSNAFAASSWCQFELTMAQTRMFEEDRDHLILVLLEEIAEVNMTPRLRLQMARQTYVEWPPGGSEMGEQLFWAQLRQALGRPSSSIVNSPVSAQLFASHVANNGN